MKLLYIVPSFYPALYHGGPVITGYHLCNALAEKGIDLRVLTTDTAGPDRNLEVSDFPARMPAGYQVYYCHRWFAVSVSPGILLRMFNMIRWADVVHLIAVYSFPTIPALLLCKLLNKPVLWTPKGSFQRWEGSTRVKLKVFWNRICRIVSPRRLLIHVTSTAEYDETVTAFKGFEIATVPNGVEIPARIDNTPQRNVLRLLYLGRLDPIKGIDNLLTACSKLNNGLQTSWQLTIAGSGDVAYRNQLKQQIERLALGNQVVMLGAVDIEETASLFANADLLVLPSHKESFGMVAAEALAHGLPVLASNKTPWQEVEPVGCGMWIKNDSATLAESIWHMSKLPLHEMGLRGREWMKREFSWTKRADEMVHLYQKVLES